MGCMGKDTLVLLRKEIVIILHSFNLPDPSNANLELNKRNIIYSEYARLPKTLA